MKNEKDPNPNLIAPCGMNCTLCASYLALKNDVKNKGIRIPYCAGCRPRNKKCAFLKKHCPELRNAEITFCYECTNFPCDRLKTIDNRYKTRYKMSMIANLNFIKQHGMREFLAEQEKLWSCPNCAKMVCCHNGICFNCESNKLKNLKEKYRWQNTQ